MSGGIGNQLFQYAAGLSLSTKLKAELILDLSWYKYVKGSSRREMELEHFIDLNRVNIYESPIHPRLNRMGRMLRGYKVISDSQFDSDQFGLFISDRNLNMVGHWQSERFFSNVSTELRTSIRKHTFFSILTEVKARSITASLSIGLHVRRGDYVTNPKTRAFHGVCGASYFLAGVEYIQQLNEVHKIFIFSDDPEWCNQNLKFDVDTEIIESSICDTDQLKLLSLCNHHVISNSSFSWWAAWLGAKDAQCVVYPKGWFADGRDLESMPSNWIAL